MAKPTPDENWTPTEVRIKALDIASREAVARAYPGKDTIDIAADLVDFIEEYESKKNTSK